MILDLTSPDNDLWHAFSFPDGQPHLAVRSPHPHEVVSLRARVASSDDLMRVLLAADALHTAGCGSIDLTLAYLMGGRMDRAMPPDNEGPVHPFTLRVVTDALLGGNFASVTLFDPHSDVSPALLRAKSVLPVRQVGNIVARSPGDLVGELVFVAPDAGATKRVDSIVKALNLVGQVPVVQATKKRDQSTGKLSGFHVAEPDMVAGKHCLIIDDLIDGGGTFAGLGEILRQEGAKQVDLYVSHGVFSKGYDVPNIDRIFTTDSYRVHDATPDFVTVLPWG